MVIILETDHFIVELVTSPPELSICTFNEVVRGDYLTIRLQSERPLDTWCDTYIVDTRGVRHDFRLSLYGDYFEGKVSTQDMSSGIATIYCQVRDELWNLSPISTATVNIIPMGNFDIDLSESSGLVETHDLSFVLNTEILEILSISTRLEERLCTTMEVPLG